MADNPAPNGNGGATAQADDGTPTINALAQYTKDLSFENPNAPRSCSRRRTARRSTFR